MKKIFSLVALPYAIFMMLYALAALGIQSAPSTRRAWDFTWGAWFGVSLTVGIIAGVLLVRAKDKP